MMSLLLPLGFGAQGYAVLPEFIPPDTVTLLIHDFESRRKTGEHSLRNVHASDLVREAASSKPVIELVREILGANAKLVRAIYFDKVLEANWSVPWHQDLTIAVAGKVEVPGFGPWSQKQGVWHVQPPAAVLEQMVTVRLHLDDCGLENGPVRVKPGSHLAGRIPEPEIDSWPGDEVACVGPAGSVLVMRPLILHASSPAENPSHRRVLHLEFAACDLPTPLAWYLDSAMPG